MDLYEVTDKYIQYLQKSDEKVLDNHFVKQNRKYIGLGIELNKCIYYLPLSSPDPMDYDINGKPRKTIVPIFRLIANNGRLLGKILLSNMIPVPESELTKYDVNKEQDYKYKKLVLSEIRILSKPGVMDKIIKNAKLLHRQKQLNLDIGYLSSTVNFTILEDAKRNYEQTNRKDTTS